VEGTFIRSKWAAYNQIRGAFEWAKFSRSVQPRNFQLTSLLHSDKRTIKVQIEGKETDDNESKSVKCVGLVRMVTGNGRQDASTAQARQVKIE
jgi:hypothetical protein